MWLALLTTEAPALVTQGGLLRPSSWQYEVSHRVPERGNPMFQKPTCQLWTPSIIHQSGMQHGRAEQDGTDKGRWGGLRTRKATWHGCTEDRAVLLSTSAHLQGARESCLEKQDIPWHQQVLWWIGGGAASGDKHMGSTLSGAGTSGSEGGGRGPSLPTSPPRSDAVRLSYGRWC